MEITPRKRTRNLALEPVDVSDKLLPLKAIAGMAFTYNKTANAAKSSYEKLRKELFAGMKKIGITSFDHKIFEEGKEINLTAEISTPEGQVIDVEKLQSLVTKKQFIQIVTATQKSVTDVVGTAILNQVLVSSAGTENVSVKATK